MTMQASLTLFQLFEHETNEEMARQASLALVPFECEINKPPSHSHFKRKPPCHIFLIF